MARPQPRQRTGLGAGHGPRSHGALVRAAKHAAAVPEPMTYIDHVKELLSQPFANLSFPAHRASGHRHVASPAVQRRGG